MALNCIEYFFYETAMMGMSWELTDSGNEMITLIIKQHVYICALTHLPPGKYGCHFADDIFKCIFLNDKYWIFMKISLKSVPKGLINNISA